MEFQFKFLLCLFSSRKKTVFCCKLRIAFHIFQINNYCLRKGKKRPLTFCFRKHWSTWLPLISLNCAKKLKLSAAVPLEIWEAVVAMSTMCWIHVGMPHYVKNVVNGVTSVQFVEPQFQRVVLNCVTDFIMSVWKLALFPKGVMRDFKK